MALAERTAAMQSETAAPHHPGPPCQHWLGGERVRSRASSLVQSAPRWRMWGPPSTRSIAVIPRRLGPGSSKGPLSTTHEQGLCQVSRVIERPTGSQH